MGVGLDLRARRRDGSEFRVDISLSPLCLGDDMYVLAAVRDISDWVQIDDHLRRVLHTLDASEDAVFIFDAATLRFSYVNEGAVRMTGYRLDELSAMTPMHLRARAKEIDYRDLADFLLADPGRSVTREAILVCKDGTEIPVESTIRSGPVGSDGTNWIISLTRDITARLVAEQELHRSQEALREAEQVLAIATDRERIARDLHDTVIQRLFASGLNLQAVIGHIEGALRERLESVVDDLDDTIRELRSTIFSLQGARSVPAGLRGKLLKVVTDEGRALGFEPRLEFDGAVETLDDAVADELVPTLREALSNIARHANATNVRVSVAVGDEVVLKVVDDGVGVPGEVLGGSGVENMTRRAASLGGSFELEALPTGGSSLRWRVPRHANRGHGLGADDLIDH